MSDILKRLEHRISALDHDLDGGWVDDLNDAYDAIDGLRSRVSELTEKLKPFANEAKIIDDEYIEGCELDDGEITTYSLTMGVLRAARAALEKK